MLSPIARPQPVKVPVLGLIEFEIDVASAARVAVMIASEPEWMAMSKADRPAKHMIVDGFFIAIETIEVSVEPVRPAGLKLFRG